MAMFDDTTVTVCDRCGDTDCVGLEVCAYDGLPHGMVDVPAVKVIRQLEINKAAQVARDAAERAERRAEAEAAAKAEAEAKKAAEQAKAAKDGEAKAAKAGGAGGSPTTPAVEPSK